MQTARRSLAESTVNVVLGLAVGLYANVLVGLSFKTGLAVSIVLTIISFLRGFLVRRLFNRWDL